MARSSADKASRYGIFEWSQPVVMQNPDDARPKHFDTQSTLILSWVYPQFVIM